MALHQRRAYSLFTITIAYSCATTRISVTCIASLRGTVLPLPLPIATCYLHLLPPTTHTDDKNNNNNKFYYYYYYYYHYYDYCCIAFSRSQFNRLGPALRMEVHPQARE